MPILEAEARLSPRLTVTRHRLSNGLGVILVPDPSAPVVSLHTWYRVGSSHERPGKTGLAHLFEHLMFNQTANHPAGEFDRLLEQVGGDTNAATWVDWTYYRDNLPAAALPLGLALEADRMANLTLTDAQVASEKEVVANERRQRIDDDVDGEVAELVWKTAFTSHPYHWPTIGWMDDILGTTPDDARAFYRAHYAPERATIVLAGAFERERALAQIEESHGKIPRGAAPLPPQAAPEPPIDKPRRVTIRRPIAQPRGVIAFRGVAHDDPDWAPMQLAIELLVGGETSRLQRRLVTDEERASAVNGAVSPTRDPGLVELALDAQRGHGWDELEEIVLGELTRIGATPPSPGELEKARARLETGFWGELETADGKAEALGHFETTGGDFRRLLAVAEALRTTTAEDVQRACARIFEPERRAVVVVEPDEDGRDDRAEELAA